MRVSFTGTTTDPGQCTLFAAGFAQIFYQTQLLRFVSRKIS
jgi:hypothetical protein